MAPSNPFEALLREQQNNAPSIQSTYATHRLNRNAQQKAAMLSSNFRGMTIDPILLRVLAQQDNVQSKDSQPADDRHCLVFWARPPRHIRELVAELQEDLERNLPNIYLQPLPNLHMNTFEITHSRTPPETQALVEKLSPAAQSIADYPSTHRTRLSKPLLGFDTSGIALTFIPAADDSRESKYTYHHLRRDLYNLCAETGVVIDQRYTVPSAHMTIARYVDADDFLDGGGGVDKGRVREWIDVLEGVNRRLEGSEVEWIVGQEVGLDHRKGTLWYGGGETVCLGKGFD